MFSKLKSWVKTNNRQSLVALAVALGLAVVGIIFIIYVISSQESAPPVKDAGNLSSMQKPDKKPGRMINGPVTDFAKPTSIDIPAINVSSNLAIVGKMSDGAIDVPRGAVVDQAAWYKNSPAPGEAGASIIEGHIDTIKSGPSVFFNLGKLKPADKIMVSRADGKKLEFSVTAVRSYDKPDFPTEEVYTNSGRDAAELRLITCGGAFNTDTHEYTDNTVVYAKLVNIAD